MNVEFCEDNSGTSKKMRYFRKNKGGGGGGASPPGVDRKREDKQGATRRKRGRELCFSYSLFTSST